MKDSDSKKLLFIERNLKSKLEKNTSPIQIRDIMVLQVDKKDGGHHFSGEAKVSEDKVRKESTKDLLNRMIQHIKNMAEIAVKHHIADNSKMVNAENNITRLSFNEFSFYPSTERGPLTELEFNALMEQLVEFAKTLPANLHLVLASFPVVDIEGNVRNVVSYIQCNGKSIDPIVTNFVKAVPSEEDVAYPGKKNAYFTRGYRTNTFTFKIKKNIEKLTKKLTEDLSEDKDFQKSVIDLIDITLSHCTFDLNFHPGELISELKKLHKAVEEGSLKDQTTDFAMVLTKLEKEFRESVEEKAEQTFALVKKEVDHLPLISMESDEKMNKGVGWSYGGHVRCVTQGGIEFTTAVDICLDHAIGVAKRSHQRDISRGMQSLNKIMDSQVDHLITSNSTFHYSENIISESFTHADANPVRAGIFSRSSMQKQDLQEELNVSAVFGSTALVCIAKPREIGKLNKEAATLIDRHNKLFIKVEALRTLESQGQVPPITNEINLKLREVLGEFAVKDFEGFFPKNEIAQLQILAEREFKKEKVHIHSDFLGTVFLRVQDRLKDFAKLLPLLAELFSETTADKTSLKQLIVKIILNKVIEGCEHWSKINPKIQEKVIDLMNSALLKNDHIDFSSSQQLNNIATGLEKQLKEAIFQKSNWMATFYKSSTKQYDINFDSKKGLSNDRINSLVTTPLSIMLR